MKHLLFAMLIAITSNLSAYPLENKEPILEKNFLVLEGKITTDEKTTIIVFEQNHATCNWQQVEQQSYKRNYDIKRPHYVDEITSK